MALISFFDFHFEGLESWLSDGRKQERLLLPLPLLGNHVGMGNPGTYPRRGFAKHHHHTLAHNTPPCPKPHAEPEN